MILSPNSIFPDDYVSKLRISAIYQIMNKKTLHKETGSAKLDRHHFFNRVEDDIDVPDGDIEYGRKMYN